MEKVTKIVVMAKQVPDIRNVGKDAMTPEGTVNRAALAAIFNPEDLNALEMALQLKDRIGTATVHVLTMGPQRAADVIRESMFRGADGGYLLSGREFAGSDTLATSYALACALRKICPDIAIAYHTQGEEIYYDFCGKEPKISKEIGEKMANLTGYKLSKPEGMASYSGYKDWVISALGLPAFTVEAGIGKNPLPLCDFDDLYYKNRKMLLRLFTDCLQNIH